MPRKIPTKVKSKVGQLIAGGLIERETIRKVKQANTARKIDFEVGDAKQDDFFPQFKTKHWDNEVNFSARLVAGQGAVTEHEGKLAYDDGEQIARFYEKDTGDEDGGFEFDVVFNSRPKSDVTTWTIQHKELDFFYQPALTPEEIAEGAERPDNVVGSYAVYHKSKKNNKVGGKEYRTGKAFHIYRPYYEDANGERVWGELNIDTKKNEMTVTAPKGWLDKAAYPVVLDPTFGYTSAGASTDFIARRGIGGGDNLAFSAATLGEAGTLDSISAHLSTTETGGIAGGDVVFYLFEKDSDGANSHGLIARLSNISMPISETAAWETITASSEAISNTDYILGAIGDAFSGSGLSNNKQIDIYYDSTSIYSGLSTSYSEEDTVDPLNESDSADKQYSIYATYTASGGGTDTDAERSAETTGQDISNDTRDAETTGQDISNDTRDAETTGQDITTAERSGEITGNVAPVLTATQNGGNIDLSWTYDNP